MELETVADEPQQTHDPVPSSPAGDSSQLSPTSEQKRHVRFPSDDVVTTYIDPPDLWPRDATVPSSQDLLRRYIDACGRYNTRPLQKLTDQLLAVDMLSQRWAPALSLRGERLDPPQVESMEEILRWIRFRIFDISDTMLDDEGATALFDMLEFYDGVENLNISGQKQLTERGWSACARLIRRAASLQALYIRHCTLDSQALRHIGRALQLGGFISEMHLERSSIGGAGLAHLVAGARSSSTLKRLHLSSCRLGPSDGTHLGILLRQSRSLETLDVEDNLLQDSGCMQVLSGLAANRESKLSELRLGINQLTAQAANAIAYALVSSPLRVLSLAKNNIGTEGILAMRDGMLRCHLQHLDLAETRLSCEAAIAIAEIAVESRTLESLDLRGNAIRTAGIMALGLAARMNQRLISIEIDRTRPVNKAGTDNSVLLEELVDLTFELDRQLAANRQSQTLLLQQQQQINRALEENAAVNNNSNNGNDIPSLLEPDLESEKELDGLDHDHSEAQLSPNSAETDPIQVFFGNGESLDVGQEPEQPLGQSRIIKVDELKDGHSTNINHSSDDEVSQSAPKNGNDFLLEQSEHVKAPQMNGKVQSEQAETLAPVEPSPITNGKVGDLEQSEQEINVSSQPDELVNGKVVNCDDEQKVTAPVIEDYNSNTSNTDEPSGTSTNTSTTNSQSHIEEDFVKVSSSDFLAEITDSENGHQKREEKEEITSLN